MISACACVCTIQNTTQRLGTVFLVTSTQQLHMNCFLMFYFLPITNRSLTDDHLTTHNLHLVGSKILLTPLQCNTGGPDTLIREVPLRLVTSVGWTQKHLSSYTQSTALLMWTRICSLTQSIHANSLSYFTGGCQHTTNKLKLKCMNLERDFRYAVVLLNVQISVMTKRLTEHN